MKIIILKWEVFDFGDLPSIWELLLSIDIKYFFPIIMVILINLFLFYKAHEILKEKVRFFRFTLLIYFIVYPILTMFHWVTALFQEVFKIKKKW